MSEAAPSNTLAEQALLGAYGCLLSAIADADDRELAVLKQRVRE